MSSENKILKNIFANYVGIVAQVSVAFFLTPFLVLTLGDTKYGIWSIAAAFTGYMSLFDLGISSAISRYVSKYESLKDTKSVNQIINSGFLLFLGISTFIISISPLTSKFIVSFMNYDEELNEVVAFLIIVLSFDVGVFVLAGLFRGLFSGLQRYDIINAVAITTLLYKATMFFNFLGEGHDLITMGYINLSANILSITILYFIVRNSVKHAVITPKKATKEHVKLIVNFGKFTFLGMLANQIIYYSDAFVIGYFMSAAAVTYYTIPWSLAEYTKTMCLAISRTYTPAFSASEASSNNANLYQLYISGTKNMVIISNLLCLGIMLFGGAFIAIWIGPEYREKCETVLIILFINQLIQSPQLISYSMLLGTSRQKFYSYASIGVSVVNLLLSITLIQHYGLIGVAIGSAIPQLIFHGIFVPRYLHKQLNQPIMPYFVKCHLRSLPAAALLIIILAGFRTLAPPENFLTLFSEAIFAAVFYAIASFYTYLDTEERRSAKEFIGRKLKKL